MANASGPGNGRDDGIAASVPQSRSAGFQEGKRVRHRYADLAGRIIYDAGGEWVKVSWDHYGLAISALGMQADLQRRDMLEPEETP